MMGQARGASCKAMTSASSDDHRHRMLGEHSESEPPDPIPNSEVKPLSADDSVAGCHVKVGNRQAFKQNP